MHDRVSVIIPSYNCCAFIAEAIEGVLNQVDHSVSEIIVIDDGSTDKTAGVVAKFTNVRYAAQEHGGAGKARNKGIELSQGDFIAFLDADDIWSKNKLQLQLAAMNNNPALDMVFGHVEEFASPGIAFDERNLRRNVPGYVPGTLLAKRHVFDAVGLFDSSWRVGEFVDWYIRAKEMNLKAHLLPDVLLKRRIHGNNVGIRERDSAVDYARILRAALDRRKTLAVD